MQVSSAFQLIDIDKVTYNLRMLGKRPSLGLDDGDHHGYLIYAGRSSIQ